MKLNARIDCLPSSGDHMSFFVVYLNLILSPVLLASTNWTGISDCGTYQVRGVARSANSAPHIIVNEKTKSQFSIIVPIENEAYLAPYLNREIEAMVLFEKRVQGQKVEGLIKEMKLRVPNPINPLDTGVKLVSKTGCK